MREALPEPAKLRLLADWFDNFHPSPRNDVQIDLRQWALKIEQALLTTPTGEWVSVRREELRLLLREFNDGDEAEWAVYDRLKAALSKGN